LAQNDPRYQKLWGMKPSLLTKAISFGKAVVSHAASGFAKVSDEVFEERMRICGECPNLNGDACKLCGCNLKIKARWATQKCPASKW